MQLGDEFFTAEEARGMRPRNGRRRLRCADTAMGASALVDCAPLRRHDRIGITGIALRPDTGLHNDSYRHCEGSQATPPRCPPSASGKGKRVSPNCFMEPVILGGIH